MNASQLIDKIHSDETRKLLYTYWGDLPFSKTVESSNYYNLIQSEVKNFIIKYMRVGIEDDFAKKHNLSRRHAFTVKELYTAFEKLDQEANREKYSLSNFHFHIKTLVEEGYVKEITKILDKGHYRTYYGRTAITFTTDYDENMASKVSQDILDPMKILIKAMNPEIESSYVNQLLHENVYYLRDFYLRISSWMEYNYPSLYRSNFDLEGLMTYLVHFTNLHQSLSDTQEKIGSLIKINEIMEMSMDDRTKVNRSTGGHS